MKSIFFGKYGSTGDLVLGRKAKPRPEPNQVLVKIYASSVNDWDWGLLRGQPFINRVIFGMFRPKVKTLGIDIAGVVESVGTQVKAFREGDEVLGDLSAKGWGGFAEYVCVDENTLEHKAKNISFEEAAALPHAGVLAIQGFIDEWQVEKQQSVLINGAGGGAGIIAIQLAKQHGAIVSAVDKKCKFDIMLSAGADKVMDYQSENFTRSGLQYDYILDMAGQHVLWDYKNSLNKNGKYLLVGGSSSLILQCLFLGPFLSLLSNRKLKILAHEPNKYLGKLMEICESGKVKPHIGKIYQLEEVAEALEEFGTGQTPGKIIVSMIKSNKLE